MARGLVDVHHHVVPVSYFEYLASKGISHPSVFESAESSHLSMMDQRGIERAILSVAAPGVHFGDDKEARDQARRINEFSADLAARTRIGSATSRACPYPTSTARSRRFCTA
jgi:hypothetical protein